MLKYIIAILLSFPTICNAAIWNWNETKKINPYTGQYDFSTTSPAYSATSAYSNNSDKLDGFNYTFFLSTNTALTQYWIGKATSSLDMSNYPIYDASTISIATNSALGYFQISDKYVVVSGTTSTAIQAAINSLGTSGGTVELLASTYTINSQINIFKDNVTLKGHGIGATQLVALPWASWATIGHIIHSTGTSGLTIGNLKIDGLAANTGQAKNTIYTRLVSYMTIQNVWLDYSDNNGIYVESGDYIYINNNIVTNCDVDGIYLYGYDNILGVYRGYQSIISNNIVRACANGIDVLYCRAPIIASNYIWGTTAWAVTCAQTNYGLSIKGNTVFGATGGGIFFYGTAANGFNCTGNDISCAGTGMFVQGAISAGNITNNNIIITGASGDGINVGSDSNCSNLNIIGNTIINRGTNRGSIYAQDMSNSLVAFNNCTNTTAKAGYGFRLDKGTANVIVSNLSNNHSTADILLAAFTYQNQLLGNINLDGVKITDSGRETCLQTLQDCKWGFARSSPTYTVDIAGTMWVGTSTVSGTQFEQDGTMVMTGNATAWDDLQVTLNPATAVYAPAYVDYKAGRVLQFSDEAANEDRIHFVAQVPHSYKMNSVIKPHVHWVGEDNTAGTVAWKIDYTTANVMGVFTTTTSSTTYAANSSTTDLENYTSLGDIAALNGLSSIILGTIYRNSTNALDTYNGKSAYLLQFDLHFERDTLGSRLELTK